MAKTFKVVYRSVVFNCVEIEAENIDEAWEKAEDEVGEIALYEGDIDSQEIESISEIN